MADLVTLIGGPYDGHRQELYDPQRGRENAGTWMILTGAWPDDVPEGCVPRAVYEPDPAPAPVTRWHYRGLIYT
jgi:hypothetical protein